MPLRLTITLALLAAASAAKAELIERDWLAPGDGLLTYDSESGREWLDVSESVLARFGDTLTVDEAAVLAKLELGPGGEYEGFTLASREDVDQLVASAGVDVSTTELAGETADAMRAAIRLLNTANGGAGPGESGGLIGIIDEMILNPPPAHNANIAAGLFVSGVTPVIPSGRATFGYTSRSDSYRPGSAEITSMMLYRQAVPEPGAAWLVLQACCVLVQPLSRCCKLRNG